MQLLKRFWFPALLILLAIITISVGFSQKQNMAFKLGAFALLMAGFISGLATMVELSRTIRISLSALLVLLVVGLAYADFMSIKVPIDFQKEKIRRYEHVIQRLKDIRTAQLAYKSQNQRYTGSFDTLRSFVTEGQLLVIKAIGNVPDTMTLEQAIVAGIVNRDTVYVPVLDSLFGVRHSKGRVHPFHADSMSRVPFTGGAEFKLEAGFVTRSNIKVPVFQATDGKPFDKNHVLQVGNINDPRTNGNWE